MSRHRTALVALLVLAVGAPAAAADWNAAVAAFDAGDLEAARLGFEEYTAAYPSFAGAHFMLGRALEGLEDPEGARLAYLRASDLDAGNPSYAYAAARAELAAGNSAAALERLAEVDDARLDANTSGALALLAATAHLRAGAPETAVETLERALESTPDYARLFAALGSARSSAGDLAGAVEAWRQAFHLDPADATSAANAVEAALQLSGDEGVAGRRLETAVELAGRIATASPGDGRALLAGRACLAAGRLEAAATWFDAALAAVEGEDPLTLYYSGRTLRCLDRLGPARDRLLRALAAGPDADLARLVHRQLARVYEARLELDTAAEHHRRGGDAGRARQVEELAASFREALAGRRTIEGQIEQLSTMVRDLDNIGERDGASRARRRVAELEAQRRELDANLDAVSTALRDGGGCR